MEAISCAVLGILSAFASRETFAMDLDYVEETGTGSTPGTAIPATIPSED